MTVKAKICGINTPEAAQAAAQAGAAFIGLVFYPKSPRHVTLELARHIAESMPGHVMTVGLFVNPEDSLLQAVLSEVPLNFIQLHGAEPPARVAEIKARSGLGIIKALPIAEARDLAAAETFAAVADWLLFDARPPQGGLPGGNALSFDWNLLAGFGARRPWMLAGGLSPSNVAEAVRRSGAKVVDVSSGVESAPGRKDPARIQAFMEAIHGL